MGENGLVSIHNATGKLLVATPRTGGTVFRRSVVLVLQHDEDGAQGVVLNHPLHAPVSAVLPPWQEFVTDPPNVFQGGPVALDSALGLVTVPGDQQEVLGVRLLFGGLGLVDLDIPPVVVMPAVAGLRIFAGYAGWSEGQLEQEIRDGGWYVVDAEARDAFTPEPQTLWSRVLRRQRGNLAFVASLPEDPSMN
jgi:putative transcriptional regulator